MREPAVDVKVNSLGSIEITGASRRPGEVEADQIMKLVSEALGRRLEAFKLSGAWFIWDDVSRTMIAGDQARGQRRRASFAQALADATGRAVVQSVSLV